MVHLEIKKSSLNICFSFVKMLDTRFNENVALVFDTQEWTYAKLIQRVREVMHDLNKREESIRSGEVVIQICLKGVDMIVGIMSLFYSRGVYCPFHPKDPLDRLEQIIKQTGCTKIFTVRSEESKLSKLKKVSVICLDQIQSIDDMNCFDLGEGLRPHDIAYLISTSGSTGLPKLVSIEWNSVLHLKEGMVTRIGWSYKERIVQLARCSFDAQISEIYVAMLLGSTVIMPHEFWNYSLKDFFAMIQTQRATSIFMVPSLVPSLVKSYKEPIESICSVIIGGEPVYQDAIDGLHKIFPSAIIHVAYGPTETCVFASFLNTTEYILNKKWYPIGVPLPRYEFCVLDEQNEETNLGELYISGPGVMKGYYNDPVRSDQVLVSYQDKIWYKTGDIIEKDAEGRYHFIERCDFQVKFNGQRLELGEIESVLKTLPKIEQVVVVKRLVNERESLVAYIQSDSLIVTISDCRTICQKHLPTYMVPMYYHITTALPQTTSGKIDRKQLPEITSLFE
jgi:amino acid adenylation domain-containing protein